MFDCSSAAKLPMIIVASSADIQTSGSQRRAMRLERGHEDAQEHREGRGLRTRRQKRGDRRGRALVDVGRPHLERRGRDLEREADEHQRAPRRPATARTANSAVGSARRGSSSGSWSRWRRRSRRRRRAGTPWRTSRAGNTSAPIRCCACRRADIRPERKLAIEEISRPMNIIISSFAAAMRHWPDDREQQQRVVLAGVRALALQIAIRSREPSECRPRSPARGRTCAKPSTISMPLEGRSRDRSAHRRSRQRRPAAPTMRERAEGSATVLSPASGFEHHDQRADDGQDDLRQEAE